MKTVESTIELPKQPNGLYTIEGDRNIYSVCDGCWYCHTPAQFKVLQDAIGSKPVEATTLVELKTAGFSVNDILIFRKEGLI